MKLGASLVREEGKVEGNKLAKGMAKLKSMFERTEAWNSTELKNRGPVQLESRLTTSGQAGRISNGSCTLPQTTANDRRALSKVFCNRVAFWTSVVTSSARSLLKIQQKPVQINMIYHWAHFTLQILRILQFTLFILGDILPFPQLNVLSHSLHGNPLPILKTQLKQTPFPLWYFLPQTSPPLLPPCSQDTDYRTLLRCIPVTPYKSLSPIRLGGPMKAKTCILIYIYVSAHLFCRSLSNACSVPCMALDAGFQPSGTEWRNFFSCSPCRCVCNV